MKLTIEEIAEVAHEVNRAFCRSIGDNSQLSWRDAPGWQKDSATLGVQAHIQESLTPEESHKKWMEHKLNEGWKYGPIKDPTKKEHPCMVPYEQLSKEQKAKDYLFAAIVNTLTNL